MEFVGRSWTIFDCPGLSWTLHQPPIPIGAKVRLRGCAFGEPGTVLRIERRKVVVLWHDLDYLARHSPDSLVLDGSNCRQHARVSTDYDGVE